MSEIIKRLLRESLLNEKSIVDVSLHDFNVKAIAKDWLMSKDDVIIGNFVYEMQDDYGMSAEEKLALYDTEDEDIVNSDRFKKWLIYEIEYRIDDFIRSIDDYFDENGVITIWREMTVKLDWVKSLETSGKRLGMFWSWDQDSAHAHAGGFNSDEVVVIFQTSVREEYIDWHQTIEANIDLSLGEDEKEITLFKNTPIKIEVLWVEGKNIDIKLISDKTFLA